MKPGQQLESIICNTKVVVVRAAAGSTLVECGGHPMRVKGEPGPGASGEIPAGLRHGSTLGKRYVDEAVGLELLCVAAGEGSLTCNGTQMVVQGAKPLPSSD